MTQQNNNHPTEVGHTEQLTSLIQLQIERLKGLPVSYLTELVIKDLESILSTTPQQGEPIAQPNKEPTGTDIITKAINRSKKINAVKFDGKSFRFGYMAGYEDAQSDLFPKNKPQQP